jgi:hypothetical protein
MTPSTNLIETTAQVISDRATTGIAMASIASPLWLPSIKQVSDAAALVMPILGVTWLVVQIVAKIVELRKGK